jgi:hypothetical protein
MGRSCRSPVVKHLASHSFRLGDFYGNEGLGLQTLGRDSGKHNEAGEEKKGLFEPIQVEIEKQIL